jgi:hypothetical protein
MWISCSVRSPFHMHIANHDYFMVPLFCALRFSWGKLDLVCVTFALQIIPSKYLQQNPLAPPCQARDVFCGHFIFRRKLVSGSLLLVRIVVLEQARPMKHTGFLKSSPSVPMTVSVLLSWCADFQDEMC